MFFKETVALHPCNLPTPEVLGSAQVHLSRPKLGKASKALQLRKCLFGSSFCARVYSVLVLFPAGIKKQTIHSSTQRSSVENGHHIIQGLSEIRAQKDENLT